MTAGEIVSMVFGLFFIGLGLFLYRVKDETDKKIHEWKQNYPKTTSRITETVHAGKSNSDYEGYHYTADLIVDGQWCKGRCWDLFWAKTACETGEEVEVAYKPIPQNQRHQILDSMMSTMLDAFGQDWETNKPRYYFKIMEPAKYTNEKARHNKRDPATTIFFCCFGGVILLITFLSAKGIIA